MSCIFCDIVKNKIPCKKVFEDENVLAFHDIDPQAPVHILVLPKIHISNVLEYTEKDAKLLMCLHQAINKITKDVNINENGFRIVINTGNDGAQTVDHVHYHILGGRKLNWPPG